MAAMFKDAPEAKKTAKKYIDQYHRHLKSVCFLFFFTDKTLKENGKEVATKTVKVTGLNAYLATRENSVLDELFVILINEQTWGLYKEPQKEACIDKALMQISVSQATGKTEKRPYDVQEYGEIVERHGPWEEDVKAFLLTAQTPLLPGFDEQSDESEKGKGKKGKPDIRIVKPDKKNTSKPVSPEAP